MSDDRAQLIEAASLAFTRAFQGVLKIEPDGQAPFWIDGRTGQPFITQTEPAGIDSGLCIWAGSARSLKRSFDGERAVENSYISGRLSIHGDFSVMARLKMENSL